MKRSRIIALALVGAVATPLLLAVLGWAVLGNPDGEVRPNVTIAGQNVGGMDAEELAAAMGDLDQRVAAMTVTIGLRDTDLTIESSASELGLHIDRDRTAAAALAVGDNTATLWKPFAWVGSLFGQDASAVELGDRDDAATVSAIRRLRRDVDLDAVEPSVGWDGTTIVSHPGKVGRRLDDQSLVAALDSVAGHALMDGRIEVTAELIPVPSKVSDNQASLLAQAAQLHTAAPLPVRFGDQARMIEPLAFRPLVGSEIDGEEISLTLQSEPTLDELASQIRDAGQAPQPATFDVRGGVPVILDGATGTGCCGPQSVIALARGLTVGPSETVELSLTETEPSVDREALEALEVTAAVSSFTTEHACCAPRVENIHHIADLIRGIVIPPGGTFSVNDTVGRRTREGGFVAAPVIDGDGNFDEAVGGGISQFATTMFNAAFFAGLDLPAYQAHGLYIDRYPYGREATLSFPQPDLQIENTSPYGVLLWPTYNETSITVTLYSTRWVDAAQTAQREEQYEQACTRVTTTRTRTWLDGRQENDQFYALYAAGEGVQCDGTIRPRADETTTTTTTVPGPPETVPGSPTTTAAPPPVSTATATTTGA